VIYVLHCDVIHPGDVIGHVTIRLNIDDFLHILNIVFVMDGWTSQYVQYVMTSRRRRLFSSPSKFELLSFSDADRQTLPHYYTRQSARSVGCYIIGWTFSTLSVIKLLQNRSVITLSVITWLHYRLLLLYR